MGKNQTQGRSNMDDERMSMNSLGNLHGRVDFLGIERRKETKHIYQKMKVMQTWIFIQSVATSLMIAYLILLTVWLAPFFPMNYNTDDEVDDNTASISYLKGNLNETDEQVDHNTHSIDRLNVWKDVHAEEIEEMNGTINHQQEEINELYNTTDSLNQTVIHLQSEVYTLQNKTKWQQIEIEMLARRLDELEQQQIANAVSAADGIARSNRKSAEYDMRLTELECFQKDITSQVNTLQNSTNEGFCNVSKSLGTISGEVRDMDRKNKMATAMTAMKLKELNDTQNELQDEINAVEAQQQADEETLQILNETLWDSTHDLQEQILELRNHTYQIAVTLDQTINRHMDHAIWAVNSFKEQDDMREAAMEADRIERDAAMLKLQCSLDILNDTTTENLQYAVDDLRAWTMDQVNKTRDLLHDDVVQLHGFIDDTKDNMTKLIDYTSYTLQRELNDTNNVVKEEAGKRERQYVHLCDQLHELQREIDDTYTELTSNMANLTSGINKNAKEIEHVKQEEAEQEEKLDGIDAELKRHEMAFVTESRATSLSLATLRNDTCEMQNEITALQGEQKIFDTRLTNANTRANAAQRQCKEDIVNVEADFIVSIALLNQSNEDALRSAQDAELAVAQVISDLGGNLPLLYNALKAVVPDLSTLEGTAAPRDRFQDDGPAPPGMGGEPANDDHDYTYDYGSFTDSE